MSILNNYFPEDWIQAIGEGSLMDCISKINADLIESRLVDDVLPPAGNPLLFQAFRETPFNKTRVVILGQD